MVMEVDWSLVFHDDLKWTSHRSDPLPEHGGIGHGGGETNESNLGRGHDDDLFPDPSSIGILDEMDLIENHHAQIPQCRRVGQQHVSEDFSGHHHDLGIRSDGGVPGEQADSFVAVFGPELSELLIRERLEGGCVEGSMTPVEYLGDCIRCHERLSRSSRSTDED